MWWSLGWISQQSFHSGIISKSQPAIPFSSPVTGLGTGLANEMGLKSTESFWEFSTVTKKGSKSLAFSELLCLDMTMSLQQLQCYKPVVGASTRRRAEPRGSWRSGAAAQVPLPWPPTSRLFCYFSQNKHFIMGFKYKIVFWETLKIY